MKRLINSTLYIMCLIWTVHARSASGPGGGDAFNTGGSYKTWDEVEWNQAFTLKTDYPKAYKILIGQVEKIGHSLPYTAEVYREIIENNHGLVWYKVKPVLKDIKDEGGTNLVVIDKKIQAAIQQNGAVQISEQVLEGLQLNQPRSLAFLFMHEINRYLFAKELKHEYNFKTINFNCGQEQPCTREIDISGKAIRAITGLIMHKGLGSIPSQTIRNSIDPYIKSESESSDRPIFHGVMPAIYGLSTMAVIDFDAGYSKRYIYKHIFKSGDRVSYERLTNAPIRNGNCKIYFSEHYYVTIFSPGEQLEFNLGIIADNHALVTNIKSYSHSGMNVSRYTFQIHRDDLKRNLKKRLASHYKNSSFPTTVQDQQDLLLDIIKNSNSPVAQQEYAVDMMNHLSALVNLGYCSEESYNNLGTAIGLSGRQLSNKL